MRPSSVVPAALAAALVAAACAPSGGRDRNRDVQRSADSIRERIRAATAAIDDARLRDADQVPGDWITHGRTYSEARHSPLRQIDETNVAKLGLAWSIDLG